MLSTVRISVIIPTWRRASQLKTTLQRVLACSPLPDEIWVHVDARDDESLNMLENEFQGSVKWVVAEKTMGPGGGRSKLARLASGDLLVSFDDDSWPKDSRFFLSAIELAVSFPNVGVFACNIILRGQESAPCPLVSGEIGSFENCGCVIRSSAFRQTRGFVPLRYGYGMEEIDVALQLLNNGWTIRYSPELTVFHDTCLEHHPSPGLNAAHITNTALFAFLRYPLPLWPLGILQVFNRVRYALTVARFSGIATGLMLIPRTCWLYRQHRGPIRARAIFRARKLRRSSP
jgi:GT2 family glycosyltransferase